MHNQNLCACPQFVADGVFYAELNELLTRELAEHGYSGVEVRVTPMRTEIIIRATRTQNVLGTSSVAALHILRFYPTVLGATRAISRADSVPVAVLWLFISIAAPVSVHASTEGSTFLGAALLPLVFLIPRRSIILTGLDDMQE